MNGFVITTHHNNFSLIHKCLDLLFKYIPSDSYVVLYVNETTCENVLNIKNKFFFLKKSFEVIYIKDQVLNNGLTGTWNQGIHKCISNNCDVITILGHDSFINENINYILDVAKDSQINKKLEYFGPLYKNFINKKEELWQDELNYKKYNTVPFIIGSFFTFPLYSLLMNILPDNNFFNETKYPFGSNDIEWHNRFKILGGKAIIIHKYIMEHEYKRTWINIQNQMKLNNP